VPTITLRGVHSTAFKRAAASAIARESKARKIDIGKLSDAERMAVIEKNERAQCDQLAATTVSWIGIEENGTPVECTPENAARVYYEHPWIKEQVADFVSREANYLGNG
jgi:hypothetical protein